jgi:hypothetical protein
MHRRASVAAMEVKDDGAARPAFALERFDWAGPDRLEVSGTFTGLPPGPSGGPLLVVHGDDGAHELPPAEGAAAPRPGEPWRAAFAWQEPPTAFSTAELRLGAARVALPGLHPDDEPAATLAVTGPAPEAAPAGRLHLEAELLAAHELHRELERELVRAHAERDRALEDLEAERTGRAEDATRFREGLAAVERAAADELADAREQADAAAAARAEAERLRAELDATASREAALRERAGETAGEVEAALERLLAVVREPEPDGRAGRM